jgi:hypothetical protein
MTNIKNLETNFESQVLDYLEEHPGFLLDNPDVLAALEIPHRCGGAVSLVEHQVAVLKTENLKLNGRLRELVDNATANQERVQHLLELSLSLLECERISDVVTRLYRALCDDFQVDVARMRLFGEPAPGQTSHGVVFVDMDDVTRDLFDPMLSAGIPVCGRLHGAQLEFLFGEQRELIGSSALLPLGRAGYLGLLAIGSRDPQRFHPAQGIEFLQKMSDLVTRAISTHLEVA